VLWSYPVSVDRFGLGFLMFLSSLRLFALVLF
jgi:hypothetical protein